MNKLFCILAVLLINLPTIATNIKIDKKDTISLERQIKEDGIVIDEGAEITIKGGLEKEDIHYLATLAKERQLTVLDLSNSGFREIGFGLFEGCTNLKQIDLPNSLRTIAKHAFKDCIGLTEIRFSKRLTSIGKEAFMNCKNLTSIKFYSKLSWIGLDAFKGCSLKKVTFSKNRNYRYDGKNIYSSDGSVIY